MSKYTDVEPKGLKIRYTLVLWSSTCPLTGFFWLLSHVIYLKLTRVLLYKSVFFPKRMKLMIKLTIIPKKLFGTWQFGKIDVLVNFVIQKFARLKSKHFSQFFWWEVNLRGLRAFVLQKVQASVVESRETEKEVLLPITQLWERRYSRQLDIDHVTQQPKETCQRTCRGPMIVCYVNFARQALLPTLTTYSVKPQL